MVMIDQAVVVLLKLAPQKTHEEMVQTDFDTHPNTIDINDIVFHQYSVVILDHFFEGFWNIVRGFHIVFLWVRKDGDIGQKVHGGDRFFRENVLLTAVLVESTPKDWGKVVIEDFIVLHRGNIPLSEGSGIVGMPPAASGNHGPKDKEVVEKEVGYGNIVVDFVGGIQQDTIVQ